MAKWKMTFEVEDGKILHGVIGFCEYGTTTDVYCEQKTYFDGCDIKNGKCNEKCPLQVK